MIELADIFGYAGTVTGISFMLPQVWRSYTTKSVEDISWGMLTLLVLNMFFWLVYGVLIDALPVMLTNGLALVIAVVQICLKIRYRNNS